MTKAEAEQIARLLQQIHSVFGFVAVALLPANRQKTVDEILNTLAPGQQYGGAIFGFAALAFVQTYDSVYKELGRPAAMTSTVDRSKLGITLNKQATNPPPESEDEACLRHLRNCFGHGRFVITVSGTTTTVDLHDEDRNGTTFTAKCDAQDLVELAEKLLIAAHKEAVANA